MRSYPRQHVLAAALATAFGAVLSTWGGHALAQAASSSAAQVFDLNIPAQPLSSALAELSRQTGLQVYADASLVNGVNAGSVTGQLTADQAFSALLANTPLQARRTETGGYAVRQAQAEPAVATMPPVRVKAEAEKETAAGPVNGYVAKRSATGTKTDTPLVETPRSISVITRELIEAQQPTTLQETLGYTAGIFAPPLASSSTDSTSGLAIRGFRTFDGDAFYQDGMRSKFSGWWGFSGYEPYGLERVEVLRGPASIMYGQGQPNGTVNLVSKRPTQTPLREIGVEFGSFERKQVTFDLGDALDDNGEWSYRLTGLARDSSTQIDFSENNRYFLSAALAWRPSSRTELILRAGVQRNEGESNNNLPQVGTLLPNANGTIPRNRGIGNDNSAYYTSENFGWLFEHQADDTWTFRSNARVSQLTGKRQMTRSNGYQAGQERIIDRGVANYWSMDGNYNALLDNQAQARFNAGGAEHTVLVGLDFAAQKDGWQQSNGSAAPLDLFDPVYTPTTYNTVPTYERTANDRQLGLYLQDQIKIDKRLVISAGARKDWAKSWAVDGTPGATVVGETQKDDAATWQAGLAYLFDNGFTPYASYAESFVPTLGKNNQGTVFKPEEGRQYEVGFKYQPVDSNLLLTAAVFDILRQNVTTPGPGFDLDPTLPNLVQTGEVGSRGFEFEVKSELARGLNLIGSFSHTKAKVTKSNDPAITAGKELIQSPRNTASLWADYALPDFVAPGLRVGAGVRHIGSTWADEANTTRVPDYTLLDLSVRYDFGRASASLKGLQGYLNVKNLTDKTYMTCFFGNCLYGQERTVIAGARYNW
jgi:iron complex outermembrane receptor protein